MLALLLDGFSAAGGWGQAACLLHDAAASSAATMPLRFYRERAAAFVSC